MVLPGDEPGSTIGPATEGRALPTCGRGTCGLRWWPSSPSFLGAEPFGLTAGAAAPPPIGASPADRAGRFQGRTPESSEIVPGLDTMALAAKAWHGYGTVVGRNLTYADAMRTAGLDWTADMAPITAITPGGVVEVDTHRATYRSDTGDVLGMVGADYHPHQPAELLELAPITLDASPDDAHIEVIGSLRGGPTMFITIALPDDIDIAGDVHMPRLVWVTSMDGTIAARAVSTYVRAVCANTIRASFRHARTSWAARHTSRLDGRAAMPARPSG